MIESEYDLFLVVLLMTGIFGFIGVQLLKWKIERWREEKKREAREHNKELLMWINEIEDESGLQVKE